ncbi:MAG: hypothetical protein PHW79_04610 [Candidatus Marinimicrobia bacterium]|nr:hypothetical protein [Candidatus Neomarinimicrobiota bacterium]
MKYDLCIAWTWSFDADFIQLVQDAFAAESLNLLSVNLENIDDVLLRVQRKEIRCRIFLDRASDADERFVDMDAWAKRCRALRINPLEHAKRAWNKATMHLDFIAVGLYVPHTIILSPIKSEPELPIIDFTALGRPFIIKPAHGGGGDGVIIGSGSEMQIQSARMQFPGDYYLLQQKIVPIQIGNHAAWFRVIYFYGRTFVFWWATDSHIYTAVSADDEVQNGLSRLREIARMISKICRLDLFSTEIALTSEGKFVVIDYINDPIDLRLKSKTHDGVPDDVVQKIVSELVCQTKKTQKFSIRKLFLRYFS